MKNATVFISGSNPAFKLPMYGDWMFIDELFVVEPTQRVPRPVTDNFGNLPIETSQTGSTNKNPYRFAVTDDMGDEVFVITSPHGLYDVVSPDDDINKVDIGCLILKDGRPSSMKLDVACFAVATCGRSIIPCAWAITTATVLGRMTVTHHISDYSGDIEIVVNNAINGMVI